MPKLCQFENCKKRACYALTYGKPDRCNEHKGDRKSQYKICRCGRAQPYFNDPGEVKAICCSECKTESMVDVKNKRCQCGKAVPSFCDPGETKAICCSECKTESMVDVKHGRCKSGHCTTRGNKRYKGYCTHCFSHMFPKDPLTFQIRCKTKEIAVRDFINANFEGFQHDLPINYGGCDCAHRRRVDHRKLIHGTMLAIETDENQHKSYDSVDEKNRYNDLFMAHSGKWIFIRFNPDKYKSKNGKSKNPAISTRMTRLKSEIEEQIARIERGDNEGMLELVHMYYDEI